MVRPDIYTYVIFLGTEELYIWEDDGAKDRAAAIKEKIVIWDFLYRYPRATYVRFGPRWEIVDMIEGGDYNRWR